MAKSENYFDALLRCLDEIRMVNFPVLFTCQLPFKSTIIEYFISMHSFNPTLMRTTKRWDVRKCIFFTISSEISIVEEMRVCWFLIQIILAVRKTGSRLIILPELLQQQRQHPSTSRLQHNVHFVSFEIASPFSSRTIYSVCRETQLNRARPTECASVHCSALIHWYYIDRMPNAQTLSPCRLFFAQKLISMEHLLCWFLYAINRVDEKQSVSCVASRVTENRHSGEFDRMPNDTNSFWPLHQISPLSDFKAWKNRWIFFVWIRMAAIDEDITN